MPAARETHGARCGSPLPSGGVVNFCTFEHGRAIGAAGHENFAVRQKGGRMTAAGHSHCACGSPCIGGGVIQISG